MIKGNIVINGRFKNQRMTGVQRYALEVTSRFEGRYDCLTPTLHKSTVFQHIWEQTVLPFHVKKKRGVLFSPSNIGPLVLDRQVVTIHDVAVLEHPEWFSKKFYNYYKFMLPILAHRSLHIITVSEYSKAKISKILGIDSRKIEVVPNGVSEEFSVQGLDLVKAVKHKYGVIKEYIFVLSSIEPRKNIVTALESWQKVRFKYKSVEIVVAGERNSVFGEVSIKPSLLEGVRFVGYVDDEDLPALMSGAIFFLYPSLYEGFGLPLLESMACGTPVLSSNTTSIPEVVGECGVLVDPMDVNQISNAIEYLLCDSIARERLRVCGEARAKEFSWDLTAKKTEAILKYFVD
ncbi:MAG: glycosyltransferase family 4 protein [Pseudomonadales bacterium]|nr:glycosyltransferase family 4 protein [Pseudomonadales bacterium]